MLKYFLQKMGQSLPLFVYFCYLQTQTLQKVGFSGIRPRISGVESEHADHHQGPYYFSLTRHGKGWDAKVIEVWWGYLQFKYLLRSALEDYLCCSFKD